VIEAHVGAFADDAQVARDRRSDQVRGQDKDGVIVEVRSQPLFRQFNAITLDPGEPYFEMIAFGTQRSYLYSLPRGLWRRNNGLRSEIKRNSEHVRVLDIEQAVLVQVVRLAP
jgi:hypothetical protein